MCSVGDDVFAEAWYVIGFQENYIKVRPAVSRAEVEACGGDQMAAAAARCAAAADALSDLDLVDRTLMSTQSWSLLPLEACLAVTAGVMQPHSYAM